MDTSDKIKAAAADAKRALGTQQAIAKILGKPESAVSHWMHGKHCTLEDYLKLLEIAKRPRTPAAIVLAVLTAVSASTYTKPSDASVSEKQTAGRNAPAVVYYVKS